MVAGKGESMEVCFVAGGVREFVEGRWRGIRSDSGGDGDSVGGAGGGGDERGRGAGRGRALLSLHRGPAPGAWGGGGEGPLLRARGRAGGEPRWWWGRRRSCWRRGSVGERLHWIGAAPSGKVEATVKIRSRHPGVASADPFSAGRCRRDRVRRASARRHSRAGRGVLRRVARAGGLLDYRAVVENPRLRERAALRRALPSGDGARV